LVHLSACVRITQLKVPRLVQNGTDVSLDCEFQLEPHESRHLELVVKWFLNGRPEPVFQWIPAHGRPQDLGPLRGRLDLTYPANRSGAGGIRIRAATTELTGDYKCAVSTYDGEDFMVKRMTVFGEFIFSRPFLQSFRARIK
jgi:Immunoglobulin V-set domain